MLLVKNVSKICKFLVLAIIALACWQSLVQAADGSIKVTKKIKSRKARKSIISKAQAIKALKITGIVSFSIIGYCILKNKRGSCFFKDNVENNLQLIPGSVKTVSTHPESADTFDKLNDIGSMIYRLCCDCNLIKDKVLENLMAKIKEELCLADQSSDQVNRFVLKADGLREGQYYIIYRDKAEGLNVFYFKIREECKVTKQAITFKNLFAQKGSTDRPHLGSAVCDEKIFLNTLKEFAGAFGELKFDCNHYGIYLTQGGGGFSLEIAQGPMGVNFEDLGTLFEKRCSSEYTPAMKRLQSPS